jgi:hypothetical protein
LYLINNSESKCFQLKCKLHNMESVLQLQRTHYYAAQGNVLPSCIILFSIWHFWSKWIFNLHVLKIKNSISYNTCWRNNFKIHCVVTYHQIPVVVPLWLEHSCFLLVKVGSLHKILLKSNVRISSQSTIMAWLRPVTSCTHITMIVLYLD